jgi:hypothetical protein
MTDEWARRVILERVIWPQITQILRAFCGGAC